MNDWVLSANNLHKEYRDGRNHVSVLSGVSLNLCAGESVAIIGASGSGKSTLLHLLGGLDEASLGEVSIGGQNILAMNDRERGILRNEMLGFVYQFHHLLPEFNALENVAMPLLLRRQTQSQAFAQAEVWLKKVGLGHRLDHFPNELSGGERQRTAIARALVTHPRCILADEPTGNLDREHAQQVWRECLNLTQELGAGMIFVTHDLQLAKQSDTCYRLEHGQLESFYFD